LLLITKIGYRNSRKVAMRRTIRSTTKSTIESTIHRGVAEVPDTASM
jgi:hypothetical protein